MISCVQIRGCRPFGLDPRLIAAIPTGSMPAILILEFLPHLCTRPRAVELTAGMPPACNTVAHGFRRIPGMKPSCAVSGASLRSCPGHPGRWRSRGSRTSRRRVAGGWRPGTPGRNPGNRRSDSSPTWHNNTAHVFPPIPDRCRQGSSTSPPSGPEGGQTRQPRPSRYAGAGLGRNEINGSQACRAVTRLPTCERGSANLQHRAQFPSNPRQRLSYSYFCFLTSAFPAPPPQPTLIMAGRV